MNEIVSLAVMLLMVVALVAAQADARAYELARRAAIASGSNIDGTAIGISIDADAEFKYFRLEDE